jgi:hypothetical protein
VRRSGLYTAQDGLDPLEMLESVEIRYHHYEQCHEVIRTPEAIIELKDWQNRRMPSYLWEVYSWDVLVLPKHGTSFPTPVIDRVVEILDLEREYRRAIVAQQTMAKPAAKWLVDTLPVSNI